jgi:hypothetical protein
MSGKLISSRLVLSLSSTFCMDFRYTTNVYYTLQGLPSSPSSPHLKSQQVISLPTSSYYQKVLEEVWQRKLSGTSRSLHRSASFDTQLLLSLLENDQAFEGTQPVGSRSPRPSIRQTGPRGRSGLVQVVRVGHRLRLGGGCGRRRRGYEKDREGALGR